MTDDEGRTKVRAGSTSLPEWSSPQVLADYLDMPVNTTYRWNATGEGPPFAKVGKHVRYRREDVLAWLDSRIQGGTAA